MIESLFISAELSLKGYGAWQGKIDTTSTVSRIFTASMFSEDDSMSRRVGLGTACTEALRSKGASTLCCCSTCWNLPGVSRIKSREVFFPGKSWKKTLKDFIWLPPGRFYSPGGEGWGQHSRQCCPLPSPAWGCERIRVTKCTGIITNGDCWFFVISWHFTFLSLFIYTFKTAKNLIFSFWGIIRTFSYQNILP